MPVAKGKTRITIQLDQDVLHWFRVQVDRAGGGNDQTLINEALRQHIRRAREPLEPTLRRALAPSFGSRYRSRLRWPSGLKS
ncbi:MAG TPA: BrnA antitoxin family protein [Candidatus Binatia bacterium]|nr:BrnA antitoxin family protein [Candidatus Binatia bacterium]